MACNRLVRVGGNLASANASMQACSRLIIFGSQRQTFAGIEF